MRRRSNRLQIRRSDSGVRERCTAEARPSQHVPSRGRCHRVSERWAAVQETFGRPKYRKKLQIGVDEGIGMQPNVKTVTMLYISLFPSLLL